MFFKTSEVVLKVKVPSSLINVKGKSTTLELSEPLKPSLISYIKTKGKRVKPSDSLANLNAFWEDLGITKPTIIKLKPDEIVAYHGTTREAASKILKEGLLPYSKTGRTNYPSLLKGGAYTKEEVFVTTSKKVASSYGEEVIGVKLNKELLSKSYRVGKDYGIKGGIEPENIFSLENAKVKKITIPKKLKTISDLELKTFKYKTSKVGKVDRIYRTLSLEVGVKSITLGKAITEKGVTLISLGSKPGKYLPRVQFKTESLVKQITLPKTRSGVKVLAESGAKKSERTRLNLIFEQISRNKYYTGLNRKDYTPNVKGIKNQEAFLKDIERVGAKYQARRFGSSISGVRYPKKYQKAEIGDYDQYFTEQTKSQTARIIQKEIIKPALKRGEQLEFDKESMSIKSLITGKKIYEAKYKGLIGSSDSFQISGGYVFDTSRAYSRGGKYYSYPLEKAGEQVAAKGVASSYFRPKIDLVKLSKTKGVDLEEVKKTPKEFRGGGVLPRAARFKDLPDFIRDMRGTSAARKITAQRSFTELGKAYGIYKSIKTREATEKILKTYSKPQQKVLRKIVKETSGERILLAGKETKVKSKPIKAKLTSSILDKKVNNNVKSYNVFNPKTNKLIKYPTTKSKTSYKVKLDQTYKTIPKTYPSTYSTKGITNYPNIRNNYPSTYPSKYPSGYPSTYPSKYTSTYPSKYPSIYPSNMKKKIYPSYVGNKQRKTETKKYKKVSFPKSRYTPSVVGIVYKKKATKVPENLYGISFRPLITKRRSKKLKVKM